MLIKRTSVEYLDLNKFDWSEDLKYWLDINEILYEDLDYNLFIDFINSNYSNEFEYYDSETELEDTNFEDIYSEFIERNND